MITVIDIVGELSTSSALTVSIVCRDFLLDSLKSSSWSMRVTSPLTLILDPIWLLPYPDTIQSTQASPVTRTNRNSTVEVLYPRVPRWALFSFGGSVMVHLLDMYSVPESSHTLGRDHQPGLLCIGLCRSVGPFHESRFVLTCMSVIGH